MANGILSHKGTIYNIEASSSPNSIEVFRSKTCKSTYLVHIGREYRMSFYLKVRLLVLLLSYGVHWESSGQRPAQKILAL